MPATNQSIVIDTPIAAVWSGISDFHDFPRAPNVITDVEKLGDTDGRTVGAIRIPNKAFHKTLTAIDHPAHTLEYSIDNGPPPVFPDEVPGYYGVVAPGPAGAGSGTPVEWTSARESTNEDTVEFCHGIYVALLSELEASFR